MSDTETASFGHDLPVSRPRLSYTDGSGKRDVTVRGPLAICGSSSNAGIVIDDATVSRVHAELEVRDDGLWVRDLGSRNGTHVDRVRVERGRVPDGGILRFGKIECTVTYEEARRAGPWPHASFGPLVGESAIMRELFAALARAAATSSTVLVRGETGTGKELVARALHEASPRAEGPFVVVDCAALPENLLEAELFGHARGAFTGAVAARMGAFEAANGGTLFLDEIGELPLPMQPKLLRALEARTVRRVGETEHRPVDVRVVAATHRELGTMAACGAFREDLFFRLSVLPVRVPPLRDRGTDIFLLLERFLGKPPTQLFNAQQLARIASLPWLGNVRELRNFTERALAFGGEEAMALVDAERAAPPTGHPPPPKPAPALVDTPPDPARESYADFRERWIDRGEALYVRSLLTLHQGNVTQAAKACGVARAHLYRLIKKHDL